jgi:FlaA1/EpsC-like NDP-sugar epimerase
MHFHLSKYRREIIFVIDLFITFTVCSVLFLILREGNEIGSGNFTSLLPHLALLTACSTISHYFFKTYDSLWRYAESREYLSLLLGGVIGFSTYLLLDRIVLNNYISVLFSMAAYSISLLIMLFMRFSYRLLRKRTIYKKTQGRIPVAIIGAGDAGVRLSDEIRNDPDSRYSIYCFLDDSIEKIGKTIHNIEVKGPISDIQKLIQDSPVREIILAMPSASPEKRCEILDVCSSMKCRIKTLPNTLTLMQEDGMLLSKSIRDVKIEELLGRESVIFDETQVKPFIMDKVVMVTGGGGSIGSELCRQIAQLQPRKLIIVDIYENNAYDIQQELKFTYRDQLDLKVDIASVRDEEKINLLFERYRPNIVFHAAAHKHVPLMEDCPEEAIKNNVMGTYNVVLAADRYKVEKFVLISTDKAVNPTNIMGASKRFCEMILQSMKRISKTEYVAVRFGNVLGSNGSVIPLFKRQIEQGGPVTITDKRIIRFFMTIPEAAQLVLHAGSMANSSEVYVLDMGRPIKILDLAEKLIRLSGYEPYTEIPITETGLRPGEKLYEELLIISEELIATNNHKIFIERQKEISPIELHDKINILHRALDVGTTIALKRAMKLVVPTYRDPEEVNNRFELLENSDEVNLTEKVALVNVG